MEIFTLLPILPTTRLTEVSKEDTGERSREVGEGLVRTPP